jgi:hypothetical protein
MKFKSWKLGQQMMHYSKYPIAFMSAATEITTSEVKFIVTPLVLKVCFRIS